MYPINVINNQVITFLDKKFTVNKGTTFEGKRKLYYSFSCIKTKRKLTHIFQRFYKYIDIGIAFSPLKRSSFLVVRTHYRNLFSPMSFISLLVRNVKSAILVRLTTI